MRLIIQSLLLLLLLRPSAQQSQIVNYEQPSTCPNIRGLGEPVLIFHSYFRQTFGIFNPQNEKTSVKLVYYRREKQEVVIHRFIFKLKNSFADRFEYIGILSVNPKKEIRSGRYKHFIVRYVNSSNVDDVAALLGIYEFEKDELIPCEKMKDKWLSYILKNPYVVTKCEAEDKPECLTSSDLTTIFSKTFNLLEKVLKSFGFEVSTGELGYDEVVLDIYEDTFADFKFILVGVSIFFGENRPDCEYPFFNLTANTKTRSLTQGRDQENPDDDNRREPHRPRRSAQTRGHSTATAVRRRPQSRTGLLPVPRGREQHPFGAGGEETLELPCSLHHGRLALFGPRRSGPRNFGGKGPVALDPKELDGTGQHPRAGQERLPAEEARVRRLLRGLRHEQRGVPP